jgi:hypothetical protein
MFSFYCDDSGTHSGSEWAIAASVIAPVQQWDKFCEEWQAIAADEEFSVFHMADFVAKKPPFESSKWLNQEKRDRVMRRLIGTIKCRVTCAFVSAVQKSAYDEVVPADMKAKRSMGKNHYTFAIRMCMGRIIRWRRDFGRMDGLRYVFDRVSKGKGEIDAIFQRHLSETSSASLGDLGLSHGGWSFEDKAKFMPLQAADIFAWEALHFMRSASAHGENFKPRRSYLELREIPGLHRYYDGPSLENLVHHLRSNPDELPQMLSNVV